jgi:hypothetical protein
MLFVTLGNWVSSVPGVLGTWGLGLLGS